MELVSAPAKIPGCPPGLEYLTAIDQLMVNQKVETLEAIVGVETNNRYVILNALGQKIFHAEEESNWWARNCIGKSRAFDMKVFDNFQNEVLHFYRPWMCAKFFSQGCTQSIEVSAPPGNLIGRVEQAWAGWCTPAYRIVNENNENILRIEGQSCLASCGSDVVFNVLSLDGTAIGKIAKKWGGFTREFFTDADNFGVTFPLDLDVRSKALLMGATILIDMTYFEQSN
ncbi:phospholipid scramblase 2-like [Teleopsis dalmanni]|uniref:phospholipid scramblase 2-like n=1 Tax=Teleopsis dalmanni TaxID=139649 RepID=UPI0018CFAE50|nr:phospholipid scramblase 2-like [Teleopsis dalmanni]